MRNFHCIYLKVIALVFFTFASNQNVISQSKIKGNRDVKIEQVSVTAFKSISVGNELDVELTKSSNPSVTLQADSNLHSIIKFEVKDSVLNFEITKNVTRSKKFKVIIRYTDDLRSIVLNGDVDVESENTIELPEFSLTLNDDAKIDADILADKFVFQNNNDSNLKLFTNCVLKVESKSAFIEVKKNSNNIIDINTENLNITAHDNADLNIEGFTYNLELSALNSSSVNGENLLTNVTKINTTEKSDVAINVSESVTINAKGTSKIELYGEPKIVIDNFTNEAIIAKKEM